MKRLVVLTTVLFITAVASFGQDSTFIPGHSYFGRNQYIEYIAGNTPYILSAPHGGRLAPAEIPDRTIGETVTDSNVDSLALAICAAVFAHEGRYPHIIICHLSRKKVDANRELDEAAAGNPYAVQAWKEFQSFIDTAAQTVVREFGKGFYIDLHGHGHSIQRLELGYLLSSASLALSDNSLDNGAYGNWSSIRTMIPLAKLGFSRLLRGPQSLGSFFENRGFPAVPSEMQPNPGSATYFSGGYNTERHGSSSGGPVSGVQIECNFTGVRDTDASRKTFAQAVAEAFDYYSAMHLFQRPAVTANLVINEVMFDVTPAPDGDANRDGVRSPRGDEFVEIANAGTSDASIGGYRLLERDARTIFTFPANTTLKPGEYTVVFGGVKDPGFGSEFPSSLKIFAAKPGQPDSGFSASSSKTNFLGAGDNVVLLNPRANDITDEVYWGSSAPHSKKAKKLTSPFTVNGDSIAGAIGQSVTRSPEITGLWTRHKTASSKGFFYSPGTTADALVSVADEPGPPSMFALQQNYPNPFNPGTAISYQLPAPGGAEGSAVSWVKLKVFDALGREVATLVDGEQPAGLHTLYWNARNLPSGVYVYQIVVGSFTESKRMLLIK